MTRRATTTHRAAYVLGLVMSLEGSAAWAQAGESCADANQQAEQIKDRCYALAGTPGMSTEALADMQETCAVEALEPLLHRCDTPWIRFSLGGAEANRGRWVRAWTLMDAARRTPDPLVEEAVRQGNALERARAHVVLVAPRSEGGAASLEVNGARVGTLPLTVPVAVEPGRVRVRVTRAGCRLWERAGTFAGGDEMRERVVCEPLLVPPVSRPLVGSSRRLVGWALVGTGAVLGVAASVFWGLSYDMAEGLTGYCGRPGAMADAACRAADSMGRDADDGQRVAPVEALCDGPRSGDLDSLCGRNRFQGAAALGLGIAGAASLVTGIVLVATAPGAGAAVRGPSAWLRSDGGGVTFQGNF
jgi:hypothetical protein